MRIHSTVVPTDTLNTAPAMELPYAIMYGTDVIPAAVVVAVVVVVVDVVVVGA